MTSAEASVKACESLQHAERRFGQRDSTQLSAPLSIWSCHVRSSVSGSRRGGRSQNASSASIAGLNCAKSSGLPSGAEAASHAPCERPHLSTRTNLRSALRWDKHLYEDRLGVHERVVFTS